LPTLYDHQNVSRILGLRRDAAHLFGCWLPQLFLRLCAPSTPRIPLPILEKGSIRSGRHTYPATADAWRQAARQSHSQSVSSSRSRSHGPLSIWCAVNSHRTRVRKCLGVPVPRSASDTAEKRTTSQQPRLAQQSESSLRRGRASTARERQAHRGLRKTHSPDPLRENIGAASRGDDRPPELCRDHWAMRSLCRRKCAKFR